MSIHDHSLASLIGLSSDLRSSGRMPTSVDVRVEGAGGTYAGSTVDVSPVGALVWVTDERFVSPEESCDMVCFSERVAQEFATMMRLHFAAGALVVDAEVVRVTRKGDERSPMLLACRFPEPISDAEWLAMGLDPVEMGPRREVPRPPPKARAKPKGALAEGPPNGETERRESPRIERILYAEVQGDYGTYKAYAINVSATGVLFSITDPQFAPPSEPDQLVRFTKRLGFQFRNGMIFRFLETDIAVDADVVRVSERLEGGELLVTIGARFRRTLAPQELTRLTGDTKAPQPALASALDELDAVLTPEPIDPGEAGEPVRPIESVESVQGVASVEPVSIAPVGTTSPVSGRHRTRIIPLMEQALQLRASDLHVKVGSPVRMRLGGELVDSAGPIVTDNEAHAMALELMSPALARVFAESHDVEFAYTLPNIGRFRCSAYTQRGTSCLAIRTIPEHIPTFDELGLPRIAQVLADRPRGLVLVTGPTGSGKSHTLAAMVNHVNRTRACHILTMEDPIEFLYPDERAHITQREIGRDCDDFAGALRRALRQDPDVILVGEMRDLETTSLALSAAETGHLVFATMHTTSAVNTPDRIIDIFPPSQQTQVRQQLSDSLQGVMAQILVPRQDGHGLTLALEILVANEAVRALIRERKTPQLRNIIQTSGKEGMISLEQSLNEMIKRRLISYETAIAKANFPKQVERAGRGR